ncbi:LysR family transcriptional regulator [Ramlibacter sp. WS9]|uniref:LysR family transcriptional regulator n=1 Tax=Ramlibacter sp. WS9 TaxID=1882741 RepID=UPI0011423D38|nr:LysR family transcriptional regulator [Ramlibacter sp. WS9]ROZ78018.1 LysR family transcriptional regulator [Ramlibacter sp. WS9]
MLRITFRQMEAFYWAATLGTVNAAAKHLFVSQPAITARVKELEDILGIALLSRSQQGVQLTPAGREVLQDAQRILKLGEELERRGQHEVPPLDGVLRLGADESSAAVAVSEILRQLRVRYPALRVDLSIERSKVLHEKLNRRELDVALQTSPVARPHVSDELLGWVQVAWVAASGMELAHLPLSPSDAASVPVVTNPPPSVLHFVARDWLSKAGTDLHHLNTCNSLAMIMSLVQEGHAIAALPVPVVFEKLKLGTLKLVEAEPPLPPIAYYISYLVEKQDAGVATIVDVAKNVLSSAQFFLRQPAE